MASLSWGTLTGLGASLWLRVPRVLDLRVPLSFIRESSFARLEEHLSRNDFQPTDVDCDHQSNLLTVRYRPKYAVLKC